MPEDSSDGNISISLADLNEAVLMCEAHPKFMKRIPHVRSASRLREAHLECAKRN